VTDPADITAKRERLAKLASEISRLRYRFDIAISAFLFDEAHELGPVIRKLETEHDRLAASLPALEPAQPEPVTPVLLRPRRVARRPIRR
jgi:hypothetical protein